MPTIVVTGASGLLGRPVMQELEKQGDLSVRGTAFRRAGGALAALDLREPAAVREYLERLRPDIIIHSAAERHPDVSEKDPDATRHLNVDATRMLAECAGDLGAWLVYISTDYVFDGTTPPYRPDDTPNPLNFYGTSKLDGERAVSDVLPAAAILRVPILYGPVETLDESPVTVIAQSLMDPDAGKVVLDDWASRHPTFTPDVACVLRQMVEQHLDGQALGGIFHWSGDDALTKFDMGRIIADVLRLKDVTLVPNPNPPPGAPRPKDCCLDCSRLENLNIGRRTAFREGVTEVLRGA